MVGYFSIAPTQVLRESLPSKRLAGGFTVVPAFLIGRLALDVSLHRKGLGSEILLDALQRVVDAADRSGGRLVVVDALDAQARAFYRRHDFVGIDGSDRLFMKIATARAALAA
ncbi:GNAT family N-acetyltransferase [Patulibacter sp. NPDC049589]|uniref:GNAT family N-acetyltransferase n=1 Tax=Patulibacter sp. NPDC049589 TaxID=3154731 RepID=UPI00342B9299